jgi:hypothetical protein
LGIKLGTNDGHLGAQRVLRIVEPGLRGRNEATFRTIEDRQRIRRVATNHGWFINQREANQ